MATINITTSIKGADLNADFPAQANTGDTVNAVVTAKSGYNFDTSRSTPYWAYRTGDENYKYQQLTRSEDGRSYSGGFTINTETELSLNAEAYNDTPLKMELTGCKQDTSTPLPSTVKEGDTLDIYLMGTTYRYLFIASKQQPILSYEDTTGSHEVIIPIAENMRNAKLTVTVGSGWGNVKITATAYQGIVPQYNLSNCTISPKPDFIGVGESVTFTLTANSGTGFDTAQSTPYVQMTDNFGDNQQYNFEVTADGKKATVTIEYPQDYDNFEVNATAYTLKPVGKRYGAVNVYKVTLDELKEFSEKRFFTLTTTTEGGVNYQNIDLGDFVNRIKRIYTSIGTASTDVIKCGNYNTQVECEAPDTDKITLDFGTCTVPAHNNDNTDYESEIQLFLPFKGFVDLDNEMSGKEIGLTYEINVLTGNGVALISVEGTTIQVEEVKPSGDLLYLSPSITINTVGGDDWNELSYYGFEPYLYVKWHNTLSSERNNTLNRDKIGSYSGFCKFIDISPIHSQNMLVEEQETLYTALQDGVYIE